MADTIHQKVDAFLRRHLLQMKAKRKDDPRTSMHAPEKHADAVLGSFGKIQVPEQQLPIKRIALSPEGRAEQGAVRPIACSHESLQVMTGNQFMKHRGTRKVYVVAAHAHHFLFMRHRIRGEGNEDRFAAEEEWTNELPFRRHHLHAPGVARELWDGHEIVIVDELDCFQRQIADHLGLLTRFDVMVLHVLESFLPIIAITKIARSLLHLVFAPRHFLVGDLD